MPYVSEEWSFWGSLTYSFMWFKLSPTHVLHERVREDCELLCRRSDKYSSEELWLCGCISTRQIFFHGIVIICRPPKKSGTCWLGSVRTHNPRRYSIFTSLNDNDNESFRDNNYDNGNMLKSLGVCQLESVRTHNPRRYNIFTSLNDNDNETFRDNNNDNDNMLKSLGVCRLGSVRTHNPQCCIFQEFLCSWQCRFSSGFRSKRLTQS